MSPEEAARLLEAQAALLGLSIAPEHVAGTAAHLALIAGIAQPLLDFPLPPETDERG